MARTPPGRIPKGRDEHRRVLSAVVKRPPGRAGRSPRAQGSQGLCRRSPQHITYTTEPDAPAGRQIGLEGTRESCILADEGIAIPGTGVGPKPGRRSKESGRTRERRAQVVFRIGAALRLSPPRAVPDRRPGLPPPDGDGHRRALGPGRRRVHRGHPFLRGDLFRTGLPGHGKALRARFPHPDARRAADRPGDPRFPKEAKGDGRPLRDGVHRAPRRDPFPPHRRDPDRTAAITQGSAVRSAARRRSRRSGRPSVRRSGSS